ncbi:MAG TPA: AAA family ATPase [Alphaproteobacteria bacterium]|nr:AAA family ATPase [Alphaproteobacteria bacterium]
MPADEQRAVIDFLSRPEAYGEGPVERIDTHGAVVFLVGRRAYKLKRAVRFPYMDYSTVERRRVMCEAELTLNRRTAPMLYEAVAPVTREGKRFRIGGTGDPVDWLVVMRRFDQAGLFDRLAEEGALTPALIQVLAAEIAAFHARAERRADYGGGAGMAWVIDGNRTGFGEAQFAPAARAAAQRFDAGCRAALARVAPLLDVRRADGLVRHCHGDLHLRNICLINGRPVLFDAIEFNEQVACIDTLYDFAFLLMDLEFRDLRALGNLAFNAYLEHTRDCGGLAALPLFLACRAGVKAQTWAAGARAQTDAARSAALMAEAEASVALGEKFLAPPPARLVAIGGLSGTGKSTVARQIAPALGAAPGAVVLRSDVLRKRLAGVDATTRLAPEAYTPETAKQVYDALTAAAQAVAASGHAVIVDAVFARPDERAAVEAAARTAGVAFTGLWLEAPAATLGERIAGRRGDASDATVAVLRRQLTYDVGPIAWHRIDAAAEPGAVAARAGAVVGSSVPHVR